MKATRGPGKRAAPPKHGSHEMAAKQAEERLLIEAAQRDPEKFDALYELHFDRVYGFIAVRARDRATAEDLTRRCFIKRWQTCPDMNGGVFPAICTCTYLTRMRLTSGRCARGPFRLKFRKTNRTGTALRA